MVCCAMYFANMAIKIVLLKNYLKLVTVHTVIDGKSFWTFGKSLKLENNIHYDPMVIIRLQGVKTVNITQLLENA